MGQCIDRPDDTFGILLGDLAKNGDAGRWGDAGRAIMTTDTYPKYATATVKLGDADVTINGIAKGAGMIAPDMATMLSFVATDAPIALGARHVTHVYYTHMASLVHAKAEGSAAVVRVVAGERLGVSGRANGVPHLHLGLLCDGHVDQASWEHIAREHEIRRLFGEYKNGERLP